MGVVDEDAGDQFAWHLVCEQVDDEDTRRDEEDSSRQVDVCPKIHQQKEKTHQQKLCICWCAIDNHQIFELIN